LIWVECLVERPSRSRTDYVVKARSQFKERSVATNVEIILPLPSDATTPVTRCSQVRRSSVVTNP
jgi:AP-1 complex subunit mu